MRTSRTAALVAVLATAGLIVSLAVAWSRLGPEPTVREPRPGPAAVAADRTAPPAAGPAAVGRSDVTLSRDASRAEAQPVRVTLPSVQIDAPVRPVGVAEDGQMELPPNPEVLGWYQYGPSPGTRGGGSVVVAGHLDSDRFGLGPLVRLRDLLPGDSVRVTTSGGATKSYTVRSLERFDRQALPDELFSRSGPERLRIITCGGEYDTETGGYEQNLVVTAVPAAPGLRDEGEGPGGSR